MTHKRTDIFDLENRVAKLEEAIKEHSRIMFVAHVLLAILIVISTVAYRRLEKRLESERESSKMTRLLHDDLAHYVHGNGAATIEITGPDGVIYERRTYEAQHALGIPDGEPDEAPPASPADAPGPGVR